MTDSLETLGYVIGGIVMGGGISYLTFASKARSFIRDSVGKNEEVDVNIKGRPMEVRAAVIYAEKADTDKRFDEVHKKLGGVQEHFDEKFEQARTETDQKLDQIESRTTVKLDEMARDAVIGRRILHDKVDAVRKDATDRAEELRQDMAAIPVETINLLLKTKELNK